MSYTYLNFDKTPTKFQNDPGKFVHKLSSVYILL